MPIIAVNEATLHFRNQLPYYIAANPNPYVSERVLSCKFDLKLLELLHLLCLVPIGQIKEDDSQDNHNAIDHNFSNF
jgi:hypothetical protein